MIGVPFRLAALAAAVLATPAQAVCDAANTYTFSFTTQGARQLSFNTDYRFAAVSGGGAATDFVVRMAATGLRSALVNNVAYPRINNLFSGADGGNNLVMGGVFDGRTDGSNNQMTLTISFTKPVRDFALTMNDIDYSSNQYRDIVRVTGISAAGSYVPALTTRWGQSNAAGGARTATNSSLAVGPTTQGGTTITASDAIGIDTADSLTDTGTLVATFAQPVTSISVQYANAPLSGTERTTGQQAIGFEGISFCPMPVVSVAKTSTPVATTLGTFALPGNDVAYELTVTNSGGSPVDASTIVLGDVLPVRVTFRNLAYDGSTTTNYSFTANGSGVAMAQSGVAYSNNGGTTFAYTPASGYDANVTALRFKPTGTMAANSSFTIRFKAQIK